MSGGIELEKELDRLFAVAQAACDEGESTADFEPAFVELLEFIEENPQSTQIAERRFLMGLSRGSLCWELISFCMYTLKIESIRSCARQLIDAASPRGWGPLSCIISSFEESWEDAEMYEYYRHGRPRGS